MGFRYPAQIHFDQMSLADEAAEKNLLIQLADRDIVSHETILERFKEIPSIEKIRLKREVKDRDNEATPDKAGPYHNPQHDHDLEKIALQQGVVTPEDVGVESSLDSQEMIDRKFPPPDNSNGPDQKNGKKPKDPNGGRPKFSQDKEPRKKRVDKPRSKPGLAELVAWTHVAFSQISDMVNDSFLGLKGKKNLRQLTSDDVADLESIKLDVLTSIEPMGEITFSSVHEKLSEGAKTPTDFKNTLVRKNINSRDMSIDVYRQHVIGCYVEYIN